MSVFLSRAKRVDSGRWIEGYYVYHQTRMPCPIGDDLKPGDEEHLIAFDALSDWNMPREIAFAKIDPETLCRCTGMLDKHGDKIFENDIVLANGGEGVVVWNNALLRWEIEIDDIPLSLGKYYTWQVEVCGTIK